MSVYLSEKAEQLLDNMVHCISFVNLFGRVCLRLPPSLPENLILTSSFSQGDCSTGLLRFVFFYPSGRSKYTKTETAASIGEKEFVSNELKNLLFIKPHIQQEISISKRFRNKLPCCAVSALLRVASGTQRCCEICSNSHLKVPDHPSYHPNLGHGNL